MEQGHTSSEEKPRDGSNRCNDEDSCYHVLLVTTVEEVIETGDRFLVTNTAAAAAVAIALAHCSQLCLEQLGAFKFVYVCICIYMCQQIRQKYLPSYISTIDYNNDR